jgi:hypothetical protein
MTRGGARKGAGRKPDPAGTTRKMVSVKMPPDVYAYLKSQKNTTETVENAIRRSKAFRDFQKSF